MTTAATVELTKEHPPGTTLSVAERPPRVLAVDVLRGITIAFMILVNDPGDWGHVFRPLDHAEWNGWTPTDMVFPTFLFLVGVALVFSVRSAERRGNCRWTITGRLFGRAARIVALGWFLSLLPRFHWTGLRLFGVLPRIGLCSLLGGLAFVWLRRARWIAVLAVVLLVGYWLVLRFVPVPSLGVPGRDIPFMDPHANLAAWIDRGVVGWTRQWLHAGSLYNHDRDPEGLLSTLPAVATTLLGTLTALAMERFDTRLLRERLRMAGCFAAAGLVLVVAGAAWSYAFPINKNLWTSSFVLLMAGWALLLLAVCSVVVDEGLAFAPHLRRVLAWPWLVFGSNAIVAYAVSVLLVKIGLFFHLRDADGHSHTLMSWVYLHGFAPRGSNEWTSLAFAIVFVSICFLPNLWLWRRKIFARL